MVENAKIVVTWNTDHDDETRVSYGKNYVTLPMLSKLDFLKDAIVELIDKYNKVLDDFNEKGEK